jgi:hypothetical protein
VITAGGVILVGVSRADSVSSSISVGTVSGATPEARTIKIYRDNRAIEIHADYRIIKVYKR